MDWSLALLSQGVECTIEHATEEHGWQLIVSEHEHLRAREILQRYRWENRPQLWHQRMPWTQMIFDWRSAAWFLLLSLIFWIQTRNAAVTAAGLMDNRAVGDGEWWRLFTAATLHADGQHLLANATVGLLFLGLAMGAYGSGYALLAAFLAGAGGNLAGFLVYSDAHRGLGASGIVMGALGLMAVHSLSLLRSGLSARRFFFRGLMGALLLLVLFGLNASARTDLIAHVGGFIWGSVLGMLLTLLPLRMAQSDLGNRIAELICGALVAATWWLALR